MSEAATTYFVRYKSNTLFALQPRTEHVRGQSGHCEFTPPSQQLCLYERLAKVGDRFAFVGMGADGYIAAPSRDLAIEYMNDSMQTLLCICCYCTRAPYQQPTLVSCYDASDHVEQRQYFHFSYFPDDDSVFKSVRPIDVDVLAEVLKQVISHLNGNVVSALNQLNRSLQLDNVREEFISLWLGLEYLTQLLNDKFAFTKTERLPHCPACGASISNCPHCSAAFAAKRVSPGTFDGVRQVGQDRMELSKKSFNDMYEVRSRLVHEVGSFKREHHDYVRTLRDLLTWCIAEFIELDSDTVRKIIDLEPLKMPDGPSIRIVQSGTLSGMQQPPAITGIDAQPDLLINSSDMLSDLTVKDDGSINIRNRPRYTFRAEKQVQFNFTDVELWDLTGSGTRSATIDSVE